ncbi:small multidrug resistance protein [Paenibacillus sp. 32O-W]|uniref:DMT family transporter n=1 Tax=Paenibacillus sp. 32O-W TaxID=1695218 RepID=UPI00071F25D0|nr:multidrug efflux SMR transporter [Paenibacillus sp. 32O-W]ALS28713.1 small multidrug resistance protein [Paenibacillus sp. 32O-W]
MSSLNKVWFWVFVGGLTDIGWAISLKYADGFTSPLPSVLSLLFVAASYALYARLVRLLPVGTVYPVLTGIGTAGTVVCGMLFLKEPADGLRLLFVLLILYGIIGLKKTNAFSDASSTCQREK